MTYGDVNGNLPRLDIEKVKGIERKTGFGSGRRFTSGMLGAALFSVAFLAGAVLAGKEGLVNNSPFIPADFEDADENVQEEEPEPEPVPQDDSLDDLELRGITVVDGEPRFSLYDPEQEFSLWLGEDEADGEYTVVGYENLEESVRVRRGDRERSIVLNEVGVGEFSADEIERQAEARQAQVQGDAESEEAESAERLREAAEELRRRRAIRRAEDDE